jgi:predicted dehydrogenase
MPEHSYGHTPYHKAFELADVYGIGYDEARASRKRLRLGLIGAGGVAQSKHLPAIWRLKTLWEPVDVIASASLDERANQKVAELYHARAYTNALDMLDNESLDGVIIATPDEAHYTCTLACLERSLPVLVEKPFTRSLSQGAELCRLAEACHIPLMTVANKRWSPPYQYAKHFIDKGPVDNPALYVGKFNLGYDYVWLLEQGTIHIFDMTRHLMGDVAQVYAAATNRYQRNQLAYPLDNVAMSLKFASGAVGTIYSSATALSFKPWERVEVYANKAWLAVEDQYELIVYDDERGPAKHWKPVIPHTLLFDEEFSGFMGMIENFLQVIRGTEAPVVNTWDGYRAYEINCAAHLSIKHGVAISLPLDPSIADTELKAWLS